MVEYHEWLRQLEVGDDVTVICWNDGTIYRKVRVQKVTPIGLIMVDGILYRPDDGVSCSGYSQCYQLHNPNDESTIRLLDEYKERKFVSETMNKIRNTNYNDVTYEQAVAIRKIMGW